MLVSGPQSKTTKSNEEQLLEAQSHKPGVSSYTTKAPEPTFCKETVAPLPDIKQTLVVDSQETLYLSESRQWIPQKQQTATIVVVFVSYQLILQERNSQKV